jgi:hypothetical protein
VLEVIWLFWQGGIEEGKAHDATELIAKAKGKDVHILADYVRDCCSTISDVLT